MEGKVKRDPTKDERDPVLAPGLTVQRQAYSWGACQDWEGAGAMSEGEPFVG